MTDLLQAPDGAIQCLACGAVLPSGARPGGHRADCPTAAAEAARLVLGGSAASLASALYREAHAAGGPRCVEAVAVALRAMAGALDGADERAPGPLRVYVAGGASERAACGVWIARLRETGVCVTHDWTTDPGWSDPSPTRATLDAAARGDLDGVRRCDMLWYLAPADKSEGSACELGAALAWGRAVVVSGPWAERGRIFPGLAGERCATHEEGFAAVTRAAADLMGRVLLAGGRVSP